MADEKPEDRVLPNQADEDLKKLAVDLYEGRIYTDRHLPANQTAGMVFMPLILGAFADWSDEEKKQVGMIYEYIDKALPRGVNGQPIFGSFRMLNRHDVEIVQEHLTKYSAMKKEFGA